MMAKHTLSALLLLLAVGSSSAALMAIDLGSEYFKVSIVPAGKAPVGVVVNEMSRRKSPVLVGFFGGERLVGEEAFSFAVRSPETIFARTRDLLGKPASDETIARMLKDHALPYTVVPHPQRAVASLQPGEKEPVYSAEELVASILQYARGIADAAAGVPIVDAVITVPAFFGQAQRRALMDAGRLGGLNVLGLINQHTAAALQYGIERDFVNKTHNVVLYDQGSGSTQVALVRYSHYVVKEAGKNKEYSQLEVRDVDWDASLGSNTLDVLLADHVAQRFMEKYAIKTDIRTNAKAMAKLRRQVRRTKEILSANTLASVSVEDLFDGRDYQGSITREEFEGLAGDYFTRSAAPLRRILERNNLKPEEIESVELLGGGSRMPRLQAALSEALGGRALDRHLDADEAVVLGAGLFAANLSTSFRLRKFGMSDMSMYGVQLKVDEIKVAVPLPLIGADGAPVEVESPQGKVHNLLPFMKKVPIKRVLHFTNVTADPIRFTLAYNASTPSGLPLGVETAELGQFTVTGVETVIQRYNTSGSISLRFEADTGGLISFDRAEAVVEYIVMEEKILEVFPDTNTTGNATTEGATTTTTTIDPDAPPTLLIPPTIPVETPVEGDADMSEESADAPAAAAEEEAAADAGVTVNKDKAADANSTEAGAGNATIGGNGTDAGGNATSGVQKNATASVIKRIMVPRKKIAKVALNVSGPGWRHIPLAGADWDAAASVLAAWQRAETLKNDNAKAKNDLESYIIKTRDNLESNEVMQEVTTPEQRERFIVQLTEQEDWLYGDGEHQEAPEFRTRLTALRDVGEPIRKRALEHELRPKVVEETARVNELRTKVMGAWPESKPWIHENETATLMEKVVVFQAWFDEKVAEQATKAPHEDAAFTTDQLSFKFEILEKAYNRLNNKKKPKPPPEPVIIGNDTTNGTADGVNVTAGANDTASANVTADSAEKGDSTPRDPKAEAEKKAADAKKAAADAKSASDIKKKMEAATAAKKKADAADAKKKADDKKKADTKKKAEDKKKADAKKAADDKKKASKDSKKPENKKSSPKDAPKANKGGKSGKDTEL